MNILFFLESIALFHLTLLRPSSPSDWLLCTKECELIKSGHTFGLFAVIQPFSPYKSLSYFEYCVRNIQQILICLGYVWLHQSYYENHRTVEGAQIFISLPQPLSSTAPPTFVSEFQPSPCRVYFNSLITLGSLLNKAWNKRPVEEKFNKSLVKRTVAIFLLKFWSWIFILVRKKYI